MVHFLPPNRLSQASRTYSPNSSRLFAAAFLTRAIMLGFIRTDTVIIRSFATTGSVLHFALHVKFFFCYDSNYADQLFWNEPG